MDNSNQESDKVLCELTRVSSQIDQAEVEDFLKLFDYERHIFLTGAGRSGLMIRAFANRLSHLGFKVSVVGEISAPHTKEGDILIIGSGSGSSKSTYDLAVTARQAGLNIGLITTNPEAKIAELADAAVIIPAQSKKTEQEDYQPMNSLFEQSTLILYDSLILKLMKQLKESSNTMNSRHADLEF